MFNLILIKILMLLLSVKENILLENIYLKHILVNLKGVLSFPLSYNIPVILIILRSYIIIK